MAFHYRVDVRDLNDNLVKIIQNEVSALTWTYNTEGGCGDATVTLKIPFDELSNVDLDYDVRLWRVSDAFGSPGASLPAQFLDPPTGGGFPLGTAFTAPNISGELRYSGFVRQVQPTLDEIESVSLGLSGYERQLQYISVPMVTYLNQDVGAIVRHVIDTYVTPWSRIQRTPGLNLVQDTGVIVQALSFDTQAADVIRTLAQIGQNAEWGVRADREFYFMPRSTALKQAWEIGDRIKYMQAARSTDEVVTKVFLRGGSGTFTLNNADYGGALQKQRIVYLPAISTSADAIFWGVAYFAKFGTAQPKGTLRLGATDAWIENVEGQTMPPLGRLRVHGAPRTLATTMLGGQFGASGIQFPVLLSGTYGAVVDQQFRIDSIRYQPTENGLDIEVDLGERRGSLTDALKSIEYRLSELRQGLTI